MTGDCSCDSCRRACRNKPGWFKPGEPETAAAYLGLTLAEFFARYCGVDWWADTEDVYVLAPATVAMAPGSEYPANPRGRCVFFTDDGRCAIHAVKPFECRETSHATTADENTAIKHAVRDAWRPEQPRIAELLGRDPVSTDLGLLEAFALMRWTR